MLMKKEDNAGKYLKLGGSILLGMLSFIAVLLLAMLGLRFFLGLLNTLHWTVYVYLLFIISVPAAIFVTAYLVFYRRTAMHPSAIVKFISRFLFVTAIICWIIFYAIDVYNFAKHGYQDISMYYSFNLLFLFLNIACIFFTGVLQALTSQKEKDWHERVK